MTYFGSSWPRLKEQARITAALNSCCSANYGAAIFIQKKALRAIAILSFFYLCTADSLAQLVEQQTLNLWVQGSIPWRVTTKKLEEIRVSFFIGYRERRFNGFFYAAPMPARGGCRNVARRVSTFGAPDFTLQGRQPRFIFAQSR